MSEPVQKQIQEDFVEMRQTSSGKVSSDDLHSLLTLARLLSLSYGEGQLSVEMWERSLRMESERKQRTVPPWSVSPVITRTTVTSFHFWGIIIVGTNFLSASLITINPPLLTSIMTSRVSVQYSTFYKNNKNRSLLFSALSIFSVINLQLFLVLFLSSLAVFPDLVSLKIVPSRLKIGLYVNIQWAITIFSLDPLPECNTVLFHFYQQKDFVWWMSPTVREWQLMKSCEELQHVHDVSS